MDKSVYFVVSTSLAISAEVPVSLLLFVLNIYLDTCIHTHIYIPYNY